MNLNKLLLFILCISGIISCKKDFSKVVFTDVNIEQYTQNNEYTTIVYVDSIGGCSPCAFQYLHSWKAYQKALNKYNTGILLVINYSNEQLVIEILKSIGAFHFVFDKTSKFKIMNYQIFQTASDGIFVIDRNKNVIFTGSPISDEKKWNSFMKLVKKKNG
ncbi:MAG: hypothetical protein LBG80_16630 [Bacteroidales bacterium]|jgi:hypothetical protein|nr:hypothetical protein [Bacteroidales bacterium]